MEAFDKWWDENGNTALTIGTVIGLIAGPVITFFCTKKYMEDIAEAQTEQNIQRMEAGEAEVVVPLPTKAKAAIAAKDFALPVLTAAGGIVCAIANEHDHEKTEETLTSALNATVASSLMIKETAKEYIDKSKQEDFEHDLRTRNMVEQRVVPNGKNYIAASKVQTESNDPRIMIFYDELSQQFFNATKDDVQRIVDGFDRDLNVQDAGEIFAMDWWMAIQSIDENFIITEHMQDVGWMKGWSSIGTEVFDVFYDAKRMSNDLYATSVTLPDIEWRR